MRSALLLLLLFGVACQRTTSMDTKVHVDSLGDSAILAASK
jgi:hypothetical protein